jgi:polygalacturonase
LFLAFLCVWVAVPPVQGTVFNIVDFGATAGDETDDTAAVH